MSGASFFKMCDPCRIRYRGYGTTKRAKWKQEREGADEDSERLRDDISSHGSIQVCVLFKMSTFIDTRLV